MPTAIKAENLSKAYQLGEIGTGTISRDLERYWAKLRGKEDPFLRIGEATASVSASKNDMVWSLKDINFEINQGDAVGIIGRNGAGKSTLLKVLSRVTAPTTGSIKVKGRIASLLEVGTGFHPELSGRDNIFLNGAILGMRKAEIKKHFDAIVDFAGVERYIDTPVKRYSSGMYVRLAFAVAAHLESEILVVDEVLAVGDSEFQKKCLGKMGDLSKGEGRTVLFVSHNMESIASLCSECILLKNGKISLKSTTNEVISSYLDINITEQPSLKKYNEPLPGNNIVSLIQIDVIDENTNNNNFYKINETIGLRMTYYVKEDGHILWHGYNIHNASGINIFDTHSVTSEFYNKVHPKGLFTAIAWIPSNLLVEGTYSIGCAIFNHSIGFTHFHIKDQISFTIIDSIDTKNSTSRGKSGGTFPGLIRPLLNWENKKLFDEK
jgi:lipopolysaccharide transport system ATP-binding protein